MAMNGLPINAGDLYRIRKVHRLSMAQMAALLDISATYINQLEKNREPITDNVKTKLIDRFDLTVEKLQEIRDTYEKFTI